MECTTPSPRKTRASTKRKNPDQTPCTPDRPKRLRQDSLKQSDVKNMEAKVMCIDDVLSVLAAQHSYDGGVNCLVCGKLYKSRVCFIKHIWEHTKYWSMFEGVKNHDRVLSIQAAIILCSGLRCGNSDASSSDLQSLLVTSPHSAEKKSDRMSLRNCSDSQQSGLCEDSKDISSTEDDSKNLKENTCNPTKKNHGNCIRDLLEQEPKPLNRATISHSVSGQLPESSANRKSTQIEMQNPFLLSALLSLSQQAVVASSAPASSLLSVKPHSSQDASNNWQKYDRPRSTESFGASDSSDGINFVSPLKRKRED